MIEMNNELNQIAGFGMLINKRKTDRNLIYEDRNYNRYVFKGDIRADREWLLTQNTSLIEKLEILIFKGKDHIKRGVGFTSIPKKKLPFFETDGYGEQFQAIIHKMIAENKIIPAKSN
jgi:predicted HAD superfamily hydrolase